MLANIYNHFTAYNASIVGKFNKLSGNTLRSQSASTDTNNKQTKSDNTTEENCSLCSVELDMELTSIDSLRTETQSRYFDKKVGSAQIVVTF